MGDLLVSGIILTVTLLVFALGKSPVFRVDRAGIAIIGAALTVGTGVLSFDQAAQAIDYRTIVLLFAMMITTSYLNMSGFFQLAGNQFLSRLHSKKQLMAMVIIISGSLSAFFINDIICLILTPIIIMTTRQAKLNPVPYLLGLAMASNVGSAATLIGNPQNILISSLSGMRFAWYLALATPLAAVGLWFIYLLLCRLYQGELQGPLPQFQPLTGVMHKYLIKKGLVVVIVVLAGFLIGFDPAIVASLGAAYLLITRRIKPNKIYTGIDFNLLIIFIGLFVIIGGVENSGLFSLLIQLPWIERIQSLPVFALLTVTLSNIVSNVPAVMLLKHLIPLQAGHVWWAALAIFSTLAGNLTLTGSIANLIVAELAKKEKIDLGFSTYLKIGFPLTICLVLMALIYLTLLTRIFHLS